MTRITGIFKDKNGQLETIEMDVKSEIGIKTTATIDVKKFMTGRKFWPCKCGCDYILTKNDVARINDIIEINKRIESEEK